MERGRIISAAAQVCHLADVACITVEQIRHWINTSEEFREMFEDYVECRETVRRWRSSLAENAARLEELEKHSRELEARIVRLLREHVGPDAQPQGAN
jgi:hypothetical protein